MENLTAESDLGLQRRWPGIRPAGLMVSMALSAIDGRCYVSQIRLRLQATATMSRSGVLRFDGIPDSIDIVLVNNRPEYPSYGAGEPSNESDRCRYQQRRLRRARRAFAADAVPARARQGGYELIKRVRSGVNSVENASDSAQCGPPLEVFWQCRRTQEWLAHLGRVRNTAVPPRGWLHGRYYCDHARRREALYRLAPGKWSWGRQPCPRTTKRWCKFAPNPSGGA